MDNRLERLRTSFLNSWFPTDGRIFLNTETIIPEDIIEIFFTDFLERYKTDFPAVNGRVYQDFDSESSLNLQDIDAGILHILGVTNATNSYQLNILPLLNTRNNVNIELVNTSPYMSEQAAIDLYTHIIVDEWSGRMDKPIVMYNDIDPTPDDRPDGYIYTPTEYIHPNMSDFIILYLKERKVDVNSIPSSLYPSVEAYLTFNLANCVLHALGRYPISLAMNDINTTSTNTEIDPNMLSSITISGKLTLSLSASAQKAYERLSDLFKEGSGNRYLTELESVYHNSLKIFNTLKYIRLSGISCS